MQKLFHLLIFLSPFIMPYAVFGAKSVSFIVNKTSLSPTDDLTVTASASGFTAGEQLYIKGSFYKEGSTNYFGLTKKGDSWIKNSAVTTNQRQITIGDWDGSLLVRSDPDDTGFSSSGSYKFKVGFYTISSGEPSSVNWSDTIVDIQLEKPSPTNTPQPTSTHTPTPNPSQTPTPTVKTVTSSPTSTQKPTPKTSPTPTEEDEEVLGVEDETTPTETPSPSPTPMVQGNTKSKNAIISLLFVGSGAGLLSAVLFGKKIKKKLIPTHPSHS